MGAKRRKPVLVIQHSDFGHAAVLGRALECQGIPIEIRHPHRGDLYPEIDEISGVVSMGGPMNVQDGAEHAWIRDEIGLLRRAVAEELPVVGVCLGGQLLASALGAKVYPNPKPEIGWFPVRLAPAGKSDRILGAAGPEPLVYQWHNQTFELPDGAELLATSAACPRQAFRLGEKVYGFQFHPEADQQLVDEWFHYEGNEEELVEHQKLHGRRFVQDAEYHVSRSAQGEKASLTITAAIGQLFRQESYEPVADDVYDHIERWTLHRTELMLELESSADTPLLVRGEIAKLLNLPFGDFVIFRQRNRLLWAIRLDDIRRIIPV